MRRYNQHMVACRVCLDGALTGLFMVSPPSTMGQPWSIWWNFWVPFRRGWEDLQAPNEQLSSHFVSKAWSAHCGGETNADCCLSLSTRLTYTLWAPLLLPLQLHGSEVLFFWFDYVLAQYICICLCRFKQIDVCLRCPPCINDSRTVKFVYCMRWDEMRV